MGFEHVLPAPARFLSQYTSDDGADGGGDGPCRTHEAVEASPYAQREEVTDADVDKHKEPTAADTLD